MKVLHINRNYITSALHQVMMEHINLIGVESVIFAPTDNKAAAVIRPNSNVVVSECFNKWDRLNFFRKQDKIRKALVTACNVSNFNVLHAYTLFTDGNCAMKLSEQYKIPYIVTIRDTDVNDFFKKLPWLRNRGIQIMLKASAICFLSETYRKQVFDGYVPERYRENLFNKTRIIPNGIDDFWHENTIESTDSAHLSRINRKKLWLVYAGRINKNKNIPIILKAIEILKEDGWNATLTVVGKIEDTVEYRRIISSPYVKYIPEQPKEKLIDIYRANDIFVMPSFTESFGLVYVEAMSQGLPVIYTRGQGFDGQFPEGEVGYHVEADSAESVAEKIKLIAKEYTAIARTTAEKASRFTWANIVKEYAILYKESFDI